MFCRSILRLASLCALLAACSHSGEEARLLGYWEGFLPAPATGEPLPITYHFKPQGLTVTLGMGTTQTVSEWPRWEVHAEDQGDLIVHIYRDDQHAYATLVRELADDELMLWDIGTEEETAAHVRRVEPSEASAEEAPRPAPPVEPQPAPLPSDAPATRTLVRSAEGTADGTGP